MTKQRPIFFCHIPKTGGTSLRKAIEAHFEQGDILPNQADMEAHEGCYANTKWLASTVRERQAQIGLIVGHYPFDFHRLVPEAVKIVILRDPTARSISHLKHLIRRDPSQRETILRDLEVGKLPFPDNLMTRALASAKTAPWQDDLRAFPHPAPSSAVLRAVESLKLTEIVGFTDNLAALERPLAELGIAFASSSKLNRTNIELDLSDRQMRALVEYDVLDHTVYRIAKEITGADKLIPEAAL